MSSQLIEIECGYCGETFMGEIDTETGKYFGDCPHCSKKVLPQQDIIDWFEMVCGGIRAEYESGWSHRDLEIDKKILLDMLEKLK